MATLIVSGASGQLGRCVIAHLQQMHAGQIIAVTRDPSRLAAQSGITVRLGDFDRPETLDAAFAGGDRLLLISTDAVGGDGRRVRQHRTAIMAAQRAGINHIVYTSLTNPGPEAVITIAPDHRETEAALAESGLDWTALRDNLYADLLPQFLAPALRSGVLAAAAGEGGVGWVTRDDCARTAAGVLANPPPGKQVLDVTGPALVGYAEIAAIATRVSGRSISYMPLNAADAEVALSHAPLPAHVQKLLLSFQVATSLGQLAVLSDTVERYAGRAPMSVAAFLTEHFKAG